jgi:hypothetical protein
MTYIRVGYLWKNTFSVQRPVYYNKESNTLHYMRENNREAIVYNYTPYMVPIVIQRGQKVAAEKNVFNFTADSLN